MPDATRTMDPPLQINEVDDYTASAFKQEELTWGHFPKNLMKVSNSFIFDTDVFNNGKQFAGFLERSFKELCITRTSLYNRPRAGRASEAGSPSRA